MSQYLQPYQERYPHLFAPITIGSQVFKNRIISAPQSMNNLVTPEGYFTLDAAIHYGCKAKGGAAMITTGEARISLLNGSGHSNQINLCDETTLRSLNQFSDFLHIYGAKVCIELSHSGQWALPQYNGGRNPMGPSAKTMPNGNVCEEMTEEDMDYVAGCFAQTAVMAKRGGADMVNIHGGHSWLLSQFVSPLENQRKDQYGGSLENRARFPIMVLDRVRQAVGRDFLIEYRISTSELIEGGMEVDESVEFVKMIEDKIDIIQCSVGSRRNSVSRGVMHPVHFMPQGCNVYAAEAMKKAGIKIPVATVGGINDPELAERILAEGKADLIAMARSFVADPNWGEKARAGKAEDIRPCIRCMRCADIGGGRVNTGTKVILQDFKTATRHIECSVNPNHGRAWMEPHLQTTGIHKKIVVVGGGPAGIQAAVTASKMGHEVVLYERSGRLGGQLVHADDVDFKHDMVRYREYLVRQAGKSGVTIHLNTEATPERVRLDNPDAIIVAVGAESAVPPIPGVNGKNVMTALDYRAHIGEVGHTVAIVGGGMVGCETALQLAREGREVELIEMTDMLAADSTFTERLLTLHYLEHDYDPSTAMHLHESDGIKARVRQHMNTRCLEITPESVKVAGPDGEKTLRADTVILAAGMRSRAQIRDSFYGAAYDVIPVGDCVRPGNLYKANRSGYDAALNLSTREVF